MQDVIEMLIFNRKSIIEALVAVMEAKSPQWRASRHEDL
jgi:spore coat protein CotF